ncbi:response regulator [Roseomonas sp. OT10]|uniref:response regulator n=1 Tax=Roseomonas cutis TaxID=2897332 RepID=UPI001E5FE9C2|nr:response regulator [Roseomonas sp. OT10]UFN48093.1 response regulator [Roseomonas sp. OT10]
MPEDGRPTILLVDDEAEIVTALQDLFEDEYDTLCATAPAAALDLLRAAPRVSVILSDQRMPGMTGDQFLARAREISTAEALLLTGYADLEAVISAINNGRIAGYSPKPWEPAALRSMVAGAHRRWSLDRALDTERMLLHGLLDSSADRIAFKDASGRFVRLNAAKAAALGRTVEECLGRPETALLPPPAAAALSQAEQALHDEPVETEEARPDEGGTRWFSVHRIPILPRDEVAPRFLVTIEHEVTEQRRMADRLRQADKMQALGTMAGGVAHDFNNLLTAILGNLQLAARRAAMDPRLTRLVQNATMAAERGAALTQRLLSFSRQRDLALQPVDANALILGMEDLLGRSLGGAVRVRSELGEGLWQARVDPGQLELAVLNLCINARDAMPHGGVITIRTRNLSLGPEGLPAAAEDADSDLPPGDYVCLSVQDEGTGMAPEVLARAFEPFFTTKEIGRGTGLGLSMVYGLMRQSGGSARITSRPGEGTCVELLLPRAHEAQEAAAEAVPEPRQGRRARILVVDDDSTVREVTSAFLAELGHDILEAADGAGALRLLEQRGDIDALVADLTMPQMTGVELAQRARALRPGLPVLLVTGYAEIDKVPRDLPVLHKPFQQAELARRVAEMIGG